MNLECINDIVTHVSTRKSQAQDKLELARYCLEKNMYRDFASNLYYSIFNLCRAIINLEGRDTNSHKTLIGYFNYEYIHNRKIFEDDKLASKINALFNTRGEADYETYFNWENENLQARYKEAKIIYDELLEYIDKELPNIREKI